MGSRLRFVKGHGTHNDFIVVPDLDGSLELTESAVRELCDRRGGIGADGVLRVVPTAAVAADMSNDAKWFMDYRNADGSVAEMCGNGIRVFARYLVTHGLAAAGCIPIATRAGLRQVVVDGEVVTVDMGPVEVRDVEGVTVAVDGRTFDGVSASVGNPHVVVVVEDPAEVGDLRVPPAVEPRDAFPDGTNVEFVAQRGPHAIAMRVHERGVGETHSCGTGACAAVAATANRLGERPPVVYSVNVPGGDLTVELRADGHALLTGDAVLVAEGEVLLEAK